MELKNREDIKEFIINIEALFDVNQWKINDIHIWPFIRINLNFHLIEKVEFYKNVERNKFSPVQTITKKNIFFLRITKHKVIRVFNVICKFFRYKRWMSKVKNKEWLFVGHDFHRVNYKNSRYNRYFDVFIENNSLEQDYIYFEYDNLPISNQYKSENVYNFTQAIEDYCYVFKKTNGKIELKGYADFLFYLSNSEITKGFAYRWSERAIHNWAHEKIIPKINFFKEFFQKKDFRKIMVLCYYSEDIMTLLVAANKIGIETIEMQHGPQTNIHLAYSDWSVLPVDGYQILPRTFWHWDKESMEVVNKWISKNILYNNLIVGNFWVNYWKDKINEYKHKGYILYSLQPFPFTIEDLFPENIIRCIKKSNVLWFVRLHPRQLDKKETVINFLKEKNIFHLINIENATFDVLPKVLANSKFHVTNFSGTTIEASLLNIETVLIHRDGLLSFPDLVKSKKAFFISQDSEDFEINFLDFLNKKFV